ncbi:MAG: DNA polymerase III subunit delta [Spirochaetaceae bacterium]|jgi:DNA polymerase-3 subunit delta|nr:DNA polymerase III subunit delta [Spirochaetaceae bacterium]
MPKGSCYLFLGPELGEKKEAIDSLRSMLAANCGGAPPEETSFYVGENTIPEILSIALNGSLFADARLLLVKNAELIKKKDEVTAVCDYLNAPQNDTIVILISDQTKIESALEKCFEKQKDHKKIFWELFEEKKTRYVEQFFRQAGFTIDARAVAAVLELVENNTDALRQECSKIALFLRGENAQSFITEETIEHLLAHSKQESAYTLFSAITRGDFPRSLSIARALLAAQTSPQEIFGKLAPALRKFRDYCELVRTGSDTDFELRKAGITALGKKDYSSARRIYGDRAADTLIALTAEYDIATRKSAQFSEIYLDLFLYHVYALVVRR